MSYEDKSLQCADCGSPFTFTAAEQEQFATRGYTNEPKRCPACRQARKTRQNANGGSSYGNGGYGSRAPRQMFTVKCSSCGKDAQVPFEPRSGRPVYCSDCYRNVKAS